MHRRVSTENWTHVTTTANSAAQRLNLIDYLMRRPMILFLFHFVALQRMQRTGCSSELSISGSVCGLDEGDLRLSSKPTHFAAGSSSLSMRRGCTALLRDETPFMNDIATFCCVTPRWAYGNEKMGVICHSFSELGCFRRGVKLRDRAIRGQECNLDFMHREIFWCR